MGTPNVVRKYPIGSASNAKHIMEVGNDVRNAGIKAVNCRVPDD
jgi:hypothetical protein